MIPARRKQLSLNFTTLLILSLFPYRTWDLHGIQPLPYSHDREYCLCLKTTTTTYLTFPTQTNTNLPRAQQLHWQTCSPSPPSSPPPASSSQPPTPSNSPIRAAQSVPPTIRLLPLAASTSFLSSLFPSPHITQIPLTPPFFSPSRRFGSCYDFCAESRKEFPVPECNGVSDEVLICEYFKSDCGELFGGCYSNKGPIPGWAVPTCPPESEPSKPEPQTAPKQDPTCQICVDNINDCGA